jgi:hypothetical protein
VLSLAPLKRLALSARVVPSEPRAQPPSVESLPARAEEEPTVVAAAEASSAPPPPVLVAAAEVEQTTAGATAPQAALEPQAEAGPSGGDACDNPIRDSSVLSPKPLHLVIKR